MGIQNNTTKKLMLCAFFAAITFLGIQMFRIPLPAVVGTPFVHFGHIFVVMGVLLQDGKRGAMSGTLGLIIFDLLNGFIVEIPQVSVETVTKCLLIGLIMAHYKRTGKGNRSVMHKGAAVCAVVYGLLNIVTELAAGVVKLLLLGSGLKSAAMGSIMSIPATVINAVFMIVIVVIIYKPMEKIMGKV